MTPQEQQSSIKLCLLAALADGAEDDRERAELERIVRSFPGAEPNLGQLKAAVNAGASDLAAIAQDLSPAVRQSAFELAVCVCNADGAENQAETAFLADLRRALGLDASDAAAFQHEATTVASAALAPIETSRPSPDLEEQDKLILNYAMLNGALELLPQSLASMAIIALQMKMVYRIGKSHGYELDQSSIRDFAATAGVGLASQAFENLGRRIIGGILGSFGGIAGAAGRQATGSAFSFVTTYALGKVAREYYAGGRTLDAARLKRVFATMAEEAKTLQAKLATQIQDKSKTLDTKNLASLVRDA